VGINGSSDEFDPGLVEGEELEDEEGLIAIAVGAAGERFDSVVHAFRRFLPRGGAKASLERLLGCLD